MPYDREKKMQCSSPLRRAATGAEHSPGNRILSEHIFGDFRMRVPPLWVTSADPFDDDDFKVENLPCATRKYSAAEVYGRKALMRTITLDGAAFLFERSDRQTRIY